MATFRPPTDNFVTQAPTTRETVLGVVSRDERLRRRLAQFYPATPRGRNVYWLLNGTFTEDDPADPADIRTVFYGGHDNVVTAEEEAALIAAGYGSYIT
jgi:hypothetical protein